MSSESNKRPSQVSRRSLMSAGTAWAGALLLTPTLARRAFAAGSSGDRFVCVFLRGGADGLNMVVPHGEDLYHQRRPTLAVGRPDDDKAPIRAIDLDGFFGLNPHLGALMPMWDAAELAFVHACGAPDQTRSHFSAMDLMQIGAEGDEKTGFVARHLLSHETGNASALRAVATSAMTPLFLSGARSISVTDLERVGFGIDPEQARRLRPLLEVLYSDVNELLVDEASTAFQVIDALSDIDTGDDGAGGYDDEGFGHDLQTIARLLKSQVGVEVACVDFHGWDHHAAQGLLQGQHPSMMSELARNLAAFRADLGPLWADTSVVVISEFGRRLRENGALGTDHGHGNMMMAMGGGIRGGKVYADWPGLGDDRLVGPGDLARTTDYRDVIAEILRKRVGNDRSDLVFPGHLVREIGIADAR